MQLVIEDVFSKVLLIVVLSHIAIIFSFHRELKIEENLISYGPFCSAPVAGAAAPCAGPVV
jgi:hypothetical protein